MPVINFARSGGPGVNDFGQLEMKRELIKTQVSSKRDARVVFVGKWF